MELAMRRRDSDSRRAVRGPYGSERTVGLRHGSSRVAFPGGVRQRLLEPGDEPREEVAGFGRCYNSWCASSGPTEESRHMLSWAGLSLHGRSSITADCVQCVGTAAGCRGEECTHCAKVVGGHMVSCDPS